MKKKHSIWTGSLSFGLVNIPVHMYTATQDKEISFTLLHEKDHSEIRYSRVCKTENKEVPWNEIVKGYEYQPGDFVIFKDEDFEKVNLKKTKTIEILNFIEEDEIETLYYVKPYFLEPGKNAEGAYELLREALKKSKKVGLAKFVLRTREHIGVIKVHNNMILLNELRYQNEILNENDLDLPAAGKANAKQLDMAIQLIDQLTVPFEPEVYKDTFSEEVKKMVKAKAKGKTVHPKTSEAPKSSKIHDIMSLLQASLETKKPSAKKRKTG